MARVTESNQMTPARKQILSVALDLWLSSGVTMALYLEEETKENVISTYKYEFELSNSVKEC